MSMRLVFAWTMVLGASLALGACESAGEKCCNCIMEHSDCWDYQLCPDDPMGSCLWELADGDRPSYAATDADVCFGVATTCIQSTCLSDCKGAPYIH